MAVLPLIVVATLWHWAPPSAGAPPAYYEVRQRDPWGEVMSVWTEPDTTAAIDSEPMPYRVDCRACAVANGYTVCGVWSLVSDLYVPPRWSRLLWETGVAIGGPGLTGAVMGARVRLSAEASLREAWPEEERP